MVRHRGLAEAPPTLMRPVLIVAPDPLIKIGLQLGDRAVDALAERDPIELVQHRLVEALNDAVGLWSCSCRRQRNARNGCSIKRTTRARALRRTPARRHCVRLVS